MSRREVGRRAWSATFAACAVALLCAPAGAAAKGARLTPVDAFGFEGDSGSRKLDFDVVLSRALSKPVKVDYATDAGGAHQADLTDYTPTQGTLVIKPHHTEGTVHVTILGDLYDEYPETLKLALSNPHGARLTRANATGFILDDDRAPTVSIQGTSHLENQSTLFQVNLSTPSGKPISVDAQTVAPQTSTAFTATPGTDYTATGPTTINFPPGVAEQDFLVPVGADATYENDEVVIGEILNPSPTVSFPNTGTSTFGVITNDDSPPSLSIDDVSANEGNTGTTDFTFAVTLTGATDLPASVDYTTQDGSATTADNDYLAASGTLNFAPGETTKQVTVQVQGDVTAESNEDFTVELSAPSGATVGDGTGSGTIANDD